MDNKAVSTDEMKVSKMITLKEFKLRDEAFAYIRANLMNQREQELIEKGDTALQDQHLLVSSPVDPEFEMLVVGCTINLLEGL